MLDDVRRAYATLGLPAGSCVEATRKRYKVLVKTWHPDRFADDPQGQLEAGERLRTINAAYAKLTPRTRASVSTPTARARPTVGRPLSRAEIDAIVAAIESDGPLDVWLQALGRVSAPLQRFMRAVGSRLHRS
jgi:hypothetical protein